MIDFRALAEEARASLVLPEPVMAAAPSFDARQVVHVPTWLWLEQGEWSPRSAEASAGGGSVEVTATPSRAVWSMGDGNTVECRGPGVAFTPGTHEAGAESPECGHVYRVSSRERPGRVYPVSVEAVWDVAWESTTGEGGVLDPLVMTAQGEAEVVEVRVLVTEA